ncbi:MAG: PAS domain S-box protein, partial [Ignavibacteriales bacterium]|nr:PAS domain S-box protein [Ignavibacteriales bacterium]
ETTLVRKNGERFPAQFITSPIRNEEGKVIALLGVSQNITERKQAAESLQESETRLQSLIHATPDAIFFKDGKGRWLLANSSALGLFGLEGKAYAGKTDQQLAEMVPFFKEAFAYCTASDERAWSASILTHAEESVPRQDGSNRVFDVIKIPLFHDDGSRKGLVIVGRDITERRQADEERQKLERELMQAQKLESLGTLASGIAHDFNNILGIILGYTSLLERTPSDPEKIRHGINAIQRATLRGASIVKQLLTFARKSESSPISISINHIIEDITNLLRETLPKTIDLVTNLQADIPSVTADATQMHQVLLNLCVNARDAMPKGGKLFISTSTISNEMISAQFPRASAREYVVVNVTDTGMGMDDNTKQRIFDPFFTTKGPGRGTGLGLALVYSIVESHHGMIAVESELGKGTTFTLYFPAEEHHIENTGATSNRLNDIRGGTETILLIEDEEIFAELIKGALTAKGYTVLTAYDGEKGLELFQQHHKQIGVVISDLALPKCRGDEVFKRIKAINPMAQVILTGGFIEPTLRSELVTMGLKQFIQKPYSPADILCTIRDVIDNGD